jgi:5-methylcytosine-specific restriction endonuclease McrA
MDGKEYRRIVEAAVSHLGHPYKNPPNAVVERILSPFMVGPEPKSTSDLRRALVAAAERAMMGPRVKRAPAHTPNVQVDIHPRRVGPDSFYVSWEWKRARYEAMNAHGRRCGCCGWRPGDTDQGHLVVDHIKPLALFPALALVRSNLQVLCNDCNMGKGRRYQDDYR